MTVQTGHVLVTGASGRLGRLLRTVWPEHEPAVWQARGGARQFAVCDPLSDRKRLCDLTLGASCVLCLAGVTPGYANSNASGFELNSALARAAIEAAAQVGCPRVLLMSTAAVYGRSEGPLSEDTQGTAVSAYGRSKLAMERMGTALGASLGVEVCNLRLGNIAGADAALGGWKPGFVLDRFKDGTTPRRSYIGVETLALVLQALTQTPDLPGVVNVACSGTVSMGALLDAAGMRWTARPAPDTARPEVHLDTALLHRLLPGMMLETTPQQLVSEWRRAAAPEQVA